MGSEIVLKVFARRLLEFYSKVWYNLESRAIVTAVMYILLVATKFHFPGA